MKGRAYCLVAEMLDGSKDADEIADALENEISAAEVYFALEKLKQKGFITEKAENVSAAFAAYWNMLDISGTAAKEALENTLVSLISIGCDSAPIERAIKNAGMDVRICSVEKAFTEKGPGNNILLAAVSDYLLPELYKINQIALKKKLPWMLVKPTGMSVWLGPVFIPGRTGCFECLAQRLKTNRLLERFVKFKINDPAPIVSSKGSLASSVELACQMAAQQLAILAVQNERSNLAGRIISVNTATLKSEEHFLTRRPQCSACNEGSFAEEKLSPPALKSVIKKNDQLYSGSRTISPEETFNKFSSHISPITGVVNNIENTSFGDGLINVYCAGHNFAVVNNNISSLQKNLRSMSSGKGMTENSSKTGALCEAIERYSGCYHGTKLKIKSSYSKIKERAILPNDCMNFSGEQFKNRELMNRQNHDFHFIPEPFDEDAEVEWVPFWSLTKKEWRYVIANFCYYGYHDPGGRDFLRPNSNGCASGNTLEEAFLQAFFEINERDAVALWWYNMIERPAIDLESFNIPYIEKLHYAYEKKSCKFWVLDITTNTKIPAFAAVSHKPGAKREEILYAFGSHFDPKIALMRALTELNQCLAAFLGKETPNDYFFGDHHMIEWWNNAKLDAEPYLAPAKNLAPKKLSDFCDLSSPDMLQDIELCVKLMNECGMQTLMLDQTQPDIGMNVVRVLVPGMRHMWRRLGPGRLYDVPVGMGLLKRPKKESEMNKNSVFL